MKILVINSGSSSIKYKLFDMAADAVLAQGLVERIGEPVGNIEHVTAPGADGQYKTALEEPIASHEQGMVRVIGLLMDPERGVIADAAEISGVGHRIVHGGEKFSAPEVVDDAVIAEIEKAATLAPLHNPGHLAGIRTAMHLFPDAAHVTVFDTAFHQTMPPEAYLYALPYDLYEELGIRRYGFHGTSHKYVSGECARLMAREPEALNCITVHLGNGCSMAAVKGGKCVDTSMGITPLAGLIMGTRCGDVDPAVFSFLRREKGLSVQDIDKLMNKQSGLLGICGMNDMRDIHAAIAAGGEKGERARLALDMACYRNRKYIGEYMAVLGRTDAVVFTAGIGENDDVVRARTLEGLEGLGIRLDPERNRGRVKEPKAVHAEGSAVQVWVIPTNEELEIARQTRDVLTAQARSAA
ncbi:MAG: acetate kinase [Desulfovibrionaceae bacterium]